MEIEVPTFTFTVKRDPKAWIFNILYFSTKTVPQRTTLANAPFPYFLTFIWYPILFQFLNLYIYCQWKMLFTLDISLVKTAFLYKILINKSASRCIPHTAEYPTFRRIFQSIACWVAELNAGLLSWCQSEDIQIIINNIIYCLS